MKKLFLILAFGLFQSIANSLMAQPEIALPNGQTTSRRDCPVIFQFQNFSDISTDFNFALYDYEISFDLVFLKADDTQVWGSHHYIQHVKLENDPQVVKTLDPVTAEGYTIMWPDEATRVQIGTTYIQVCPKGSVVNCYPITFPSNVIASFTPEESIDEHTIKEILCLDKEWIGLPHLDLQRPFSSEILKILDQQNSASGCSLQVYSQHSGHFEVRFEGTSTCPYTPTGMGFAFEKIDVIVKPKTPEVRRSLIPNDRAFVVVLPDANSLYEWRNETTNEVVGYGTRFIPPSTGSYSITAVPITPGFLPPEPAHITPTAADLVSSYTLATTVVKQGIKQVSELASLVPVSDLGQSITHYDEFNRTTQQVAIGAANDGGDVVQAFFYDQWDRQLNQYMPFVVDGQNKGKEVANALGGGFGNANYTSSLQYSFYQAQPDIAHDPKPFSSIVFNDARDLTKITKSFAPGADWNQPTGDHYSKQDAWLYNPPAGLTDAEKIYRWEWSATETGIRSNSTYEAGELVVSESRDEEGALNQSFTDVFGLTVATRIYDRTDPSQFLTSYTVFDRAGRARISIPPKLAALFSLSAVHSCFGSSQSQMEMDKNSACLAAFGTWSDYDEEGRVIWMRHPGTGPTETVYDKLGRAVLSQDETQRLNGNTWSFIKYDFEGRSVLTGDIEGGTKTWQNWQEEANLASQASNWVWYEKRTESPVDFHGYTNTAFPVLDIGQFTLMSVNYYDDYSFKRGNTYGDLPASDPQQNVNDHWPTSPDMGTAPTLVKNSRNLATGKKVRVLHPDPNTPEQWLMDTYYYDEKERIIATGSDTHLETEVDDDDWHCIQRDTDYGRVVREHFSHNNQYLDPNGLLGNSLPYWKDYLYYDNGKLLSISHSMGGTSASDAQELVRYDYNVFGQVKTKHLAMNRHGHALQHVDYKHNIRGWLTHINDPDQILPIAGTQSNGLPPDADVFGMELKYQNLGGPEHTSATSRTLGVVAEAALPNRFDGTISGVVWKTSKDHVGRSYTYSYDGFNRLSEANYRAVKNSTTSQWGQHEPNLYHAWDHRYDANGNLTKMQQNGPKSLGDTTATNTDFLTYKYENVGTNLDGNRLQNVTDGGTDASYDLQTNRTPEGYPLRRDYNEADNDDAATQYTYDAAGRLLSDKGKRIKMITYNRLDLPEKILFEDELHNETSIITTLYAADGRKLTYTYERPDGGEGLPAKTVTTHYCNGWVYRLSHEDQRQPFEDRMDMAYLNTPVGKVVATAVMDEMDVGTMAGSWLYQYHIYDHQGNLRIAFQENYKKDEYEAGMEQVNAEQEESEFEFVSETRHNDPANSRTGNYSAQLNPLTGTPLGPMKWMPVQAGDTVSMEAFAHYTANTTTGTPAWQNTLAGFLLGSLANTVYNLGTDGGAPSPTVQQLILLGSTLLANPINSNGGNTAVPRAYMKWISYDVDSQYLSQGYMPITSNSQTEYERLFLQTVAQQDGFIQFFVANETPQAVYFDDISGLVRRPKVIQQAHYYPFGLPMAKITDLGNPEYTYFFTGKELYEDEALQWYNYGARMYDVQIGRWTTTDPEWEFASPYTYCGNDPVNLIDPDGRSSKFGNWVLNTTFIKGTGFDSWLAKNERAILMTSSIVLSVGVGILTGGTAGLIMGAAISGGFSGLSIGSAKGANANERLLYFAGGAAIGALSAWGGGAIASNIGKNSKSEYAGLIAKTVGSAVSGAINGTGMAILNYREGDDDDVVLRGAGIGLLAGAAGGATSAYYGGGFGAFSGGFVSSTTGGLLNGKSVRGSVEQGLVSGAISYGSYHASQYVNYRKFDKQGLPITRNQFNKMSRAAQRTFARGVEQGGALKRNGGIRWGENPTVDGIDIMADVSEDEFATLHGHPRHNSIAREYHSPDDIEINSRFDRSSFVIGRSSYFFNNSCDQDACNLGTNQIFNPYQSFTFNFGW